MFGLVDRRASVHPAIQSDEADFASKSPQTPYPPDELTGGAHFGSAPIVARRRSSPHQRSQYSKSRSALALETEGDLGSTRFLSALPIAGAGANAYESKRE
jgi:hypothetical protein